jgi:predicted RNA-binding protein YlqC (UPF0109 family)
MLENLPSELVNFLLKKIMMQPNQVRIYHMIILKKIKMVVAFTLRDIGKKFQEKKILKGII